MKTKLFVAAVLSMSLGAVAYAQCDSPLGCGGPTAEERSQLRKDMSNFDKNREARQAARAEFAKKPLAEQKAIMLDHVDKGLARLTETRTCLTQAKTHDALQACQGDKPRRPRTP